jgi:hypothetical protein
VIKDRRTQLLIVALAATLGAVAWVSGSDDEIAAPAARADHERRPEPGGDRTGGEMPALSLDGLDARGLDEMKTDLFAGKSWYVPPPPPPPPKPMAPPVPFSFLGRLIEGDHAAVFVANGNRNQVVHIGDVVDTAWRVDAIGETEMKLTYLPLNEEKTLALGAAP